MQSQINEQALEATIEKYITGANLKELREQSTAWSIVSERIELYRSGNGYYIGSSDDYNPQFAVDEYRFWHFLETVTKKK